MTRARKRTPCELCPTGMCSEHPREDVHAGAVVPGQRTPDPAEYFRADWPRCAFWTYGADCGECAQCRAAELFTALPSGAEVSLRADDRPGVRALAEAAGMPPGDARLTLTVRRRGV